MSDVIEYTPEQLRLLQLTGIEMLIEVDRICRKHGINYSMAGGTLIGAVRNKGFIPWDDDVDVMMTKAQYEKFFEACKTDLDTDRFFFQDYRTDEGYRWGFGKLRRLGTEYIKAGYENATYTTGVCIDIFPYEYVPDNVIARSIFFFEMFLVRKMLYSEIGRTKDKNAFYRFLYKMLYHIPKERIYKYKEHVTRVFSTKRHSRIINIMYPNKHKPCKYGFPSEHFEEFVQLEFEGMKFSAVKQYDEYLKLRYGDYMAPPSNENRKGVMDASKLELVDLTLEGLQAIYQKNIIES